MIYTDSDKRNGLDHTRAFAISAGVLILFIIAGSVSVGGDTKEQTADSDAGTIAAAAIQELLQMSVCDFEHPMYEEVMPAHRALLIDRHSGVRDADPYVPWLAARLVHAAAAGRLFVQRRGDEHLSLRIKDPMSDDKFWYIASVSNAADSAREQEESAQIFFLWPFAGSYITPDSLDDEDPFDTHHPIHGFASGDILQIDIYRFPRSSIEDRYDVDPAELIKKEGSAPILRMPLPVIVLKCE